MRKLLLAVATGLTILLATHSAALAGAVASTFDVQLTNYYVSIPGSIIGESPIDTVPLSGAISFITHAFPTDPIRPSSFVKALAIPSLTGLGGTTFLQYTANGSSTPATFGWQPSDPLRILFETRLISHFFSNDPITPIPPEAAQIYMLLVDATLNFDAAGVLTSAAINSITVSPVGP